MQNMMWDFYYMDSIIAEVKGTKYFVCFKYVEIVNIISEAVEITLQ